MKHEKRIKAPMGPEERDYLKQQTRAKTLTPFCKLRPIRKAKRHMAKDSRKVNR